MLAWLARNGSTLRFSSRWFIFVRGIRESVTLHPTMFLVFSIWGRVSENRIFLIWLHGRVPYHILDGSQGKGETRVLPLPLSPDPCAHSIGECAR